MAGVLLLSARLYLQSVHGADGVRKSQSGIRQTERGDPAASTDSEWSHKNWFERDLAAVDYPVLADTTQKVARDYDVLNEDNGEAERGTFIIDPEGMLRYALISAGSVGRSVKETLRVLEALQTGERCPVEWEPGKETLGKAS